MILYLGDKQQSCSCILLSCGFPIRVQKTGNNLQNKTKRKKVNALALQMLQNYPKRLKRNAEGGGGGFTARKRNQTEYTDQRKWYELYEWNFYNRRGLESSDVV